MRDELLVGVDVGSSKLCSTVAVREQSGRTLYVAHGSTPSDGLQAGSVIDVGALATSFEYALDEIRHLIGMPVQDLVMSVSGARLEAIDRTETLALDPATPISHQDVMRALPDARDATPDGRQVVHRVVRSLVVDGQVVRDPVGMLGRTLTVRTRDFAALSEFATRLHLAAQQAGARVLALVPEGVASAAAALTDDEREQGVVLLDIGSATTDLALYFNGELYDLAAIPLGGHHVTTDLAALLDVPVDDAEDLKCRHGIADRAVVTEAEAFDWGARTVASLQRQARQGRVPAEVVQVIAGARAEQILNRVNGLLEGWHVKPNLRAGVVLTGGSANLSGIELMAADILGLPVRLGGVLPWEGFPAIPDPSVTASLGLVRYCADRSRPPQQPAERPLVERLMVTGASGEDADNGSHWNPPPVRTRRRPPPRRRSSSRGWGPVLRGWLREFVPAREG
jgi:cell division protein FtsA